MKRWLDYDGTHTPDEVRDYLRFAKAQAWCLSAGDIKGIWITRVERSQACTWGVIWGCAGDFQAHKEDAIAFYGAIERWLESCGCKFIEWSGRDGWSRLFPGYGKHAVVLRKTL